MEKPKMNNKEINKFLKYLDCCMEDMKDIKGWVSCLNVLKCDLNIYKKRNNVKEVRNNGCKR